MEALKADLAKEQFQVSTVKRTQKQRQPAPPFTTSTLQQEASRKLNMAPRRTMSIAQQLYEGVDIEGEGTIGLITYMRTDSLRLSEDALDAAKQFIVARYGADYYPPETRRFKAKANAQDAHEAIRPCSSASRATFRVPLRSGASMQTVPSASPVSRRLRMAK